MKKITKILAVLLAITVLAFTACKPQNQNSASDSSGTSVNQSSGVTSEGNSGNSSDSTASDESSQPTKPAEPDPEEPVSTTPFESDVAKTYALPELGDAKNALSDNLFVFGDGYAIVSGDQRLAVTTSGIRIDSLKNIERAAEGNEYSLLAQTSNAVEIRVTCDKSFVKTISAKGNYSEFRSANGDLYAISDITTKFGTELCVYDRYFVLNGGFGVERTVKAISVSEWAGYGSVFSMDIAGKGDNEYFVPSRVYRTCDAINKGQEYLASTSKLPTPVATVRNKDTGMFISINDPNPNITTKSGDRLSGASVSGEYLYGALGMNKTGVMSAYPCMEYGQNGDAKRYAPLNVQNDIRHTFVIRVGESDDFNDAMSISLGKAVEDMEKIDYSADLDRVYKTSIEDMSSLVVYRDTAYVLPFAMFVQTGAALAYVAQSGYIGMQISCGYELLRYGLSTDNEEIYQNGYNMVNMWATTAIPEGTNSGIFYCYNNGKGYGDTAPTLRQLSDGAEGMLDAMRLMEVNRPEVNVDDWWEFVYGYAEFLVSHQNADGSWYRAYDYDGKLLTENNKWNIVIDDNTLADAKFSTQIPIRFLVRMYEYTGEEKYLNAAIKAGNYVKTDVIDILEYRGGTLDQKGNYEREAGIYAFYAMSALYGATGEKEWLDYAEKAGAYAMSFVFTHDYVVYNYDPSNLAGVPLTEGCTAGFSPIVRSETGVIGVDVFSGYLYYEFFKMYLWTGKDCYLDEALILENCQKRTMDIDGKYNFYKKSFMCEATGIMNFSFSTAEGTGVWLPWITNSVIEPMTFMLETFGSYKIEQLIEDNTTEQLSAMLSKYGNGGYEYREF